MNLRHLLDTQRRLARDDRGAAAVEFTLWVTLFFFVIMIALDFGGFYLQRGKVSEAVSAAAVSAFKERENTTFADLPDYVKALAKDQALAVSTSCNGTSGSCTNFNRTCSCLKTDGSYVAAACGNICTGPGMTGGSTAGYYLTVHASRPYSGMMMPGNALTPSTIEQQATVRLQ